VGSRIEKGKKMNSHRKAMNQRQTELRRIMMSFDQHDEATELFLRQHAMLHCAKMAQTESWSYEDAILDDITDEKFRRIPKNSKHSVAWCIWHIARIEDITMNILVADSPQVLNEGDWLGQMNIKYLDSGNAMSEDDIVSLSVTIDRKALRAYRLTVGRKTHEIVKQLDPDDLKQKVNSARLQRVLDEGALVEEAVGIKEYWSRRNIAGLLLMPPTRHSLIHLNEAARLKRSR
jgi:hypothetical protein